MKSSQDDGVKSSQGILDMAPALLFLVTGAFWVGMLATGGDILLFWAALAGFASGALLIMRSSNWVTRPLAVATAVFGLTLAFYQVYIGLSIVGTNLGTIGAYSSVLFAVLTVVYLYLLFVSLKKA